MSGKSNASDDLPAYKVHGNINQLDVLFNKAMYDLLFSSLGVKHCCSGLEIALWQEHGIVDNRKARSKFNE